MARKSTLVRLLATGVLVAGVACRDVSSPTAPSARAALPAAAQTAQVPDVATLARTIPGFGGFYLDAGVPTVYLTDVRERGAAETALGAYARTLGLAPGDIRILQGRYRYQELDRWFHAVSLEALAQAGVVFVDLDEANNRVLVGVENATAAATAHAVVGRLRVPDGAVAIEEAEPIHFVQTLRDKVRPVVGGLQIRFSGFLCSLSFNATRAGVGGFVTASHCSDKQGAVDGTLYYQPLNQVAAEFIGTEIADPPFFRNSQACPRGRKCRHSDANFADGATGVMFTLGGIAKTTGANSGSLAIAGSFAVTAEAPGNAVVGQTLNKVGRTTGWTQGQVTRTCVDTGVSGSNIVLLCQDFVAAGVGGGDSGSPVFGITGGDQVRLHGTLWGGNSAGTTFVFSPLTNIERELGALTSF